MVRKTYLPEQIINKLREAAILLSSANYCVSVVNHMNEYRSLIAKCRGRIISAKRVANEIAS